MVTGALPDRTQASHWCSEETITPLIQENLNRPPHSQDAWAQPGAGSGGRFGFLDAIRAIAAFAKNIGSQ